MMQEIWNTVAQLWKDHMYLFIFVWTITGYTLGVIMFAMIEYRSSVRWNELYNSKLRPHLILGDFTSMLNVFFALYGFIMIPIFALYLVIMLIKKIGRGAYKLAGLKVNKDTVIWK